MACVQDVFMDAPNATHIEHTTRLMYLRYYSGATGTKHTYRLQLQYHKTAGAALAFEGRSEHAQFAWDGTSFYASQRAMDCLTRGFAFALPSGYLSEFQLKLLADSRMPSLYIGCWKDHSQYERELAGQHLISLTTRACIAQLLSRSTESTLLMHAMVQTVNDPANKHLTWSYRDRLLQEKLFTILNQAWPLV